jgi:SAM-dependent methyltransferase
MDANLSETARGQLTGAGAEIYETFFVPALFGAWAPVTVAAARCAPGDRVLDVACGTGVAARAAADAVGPDGRVTGLDCNEGMLSVARRIAPEIAWRSGAAEALPFPDASFDAVLCQFGLMFFEDRATALSEMWRVLAPGGRLAVAVCGPLERAPGYAALVALLRRLFGERAAAEMQAPFSLGNAGDVSALFAKAGIPDASLETHDGRARFPSIEAWMHTDVKGWTLGHLIDDAGYTRLVAAAEIDLAPFAGPDGHVTFPFPAHVATAGKPAA